MSAVTSNTSSEQTARVIVLCFLVFLSLAASADTLTGKVGKITDGDTLYVLDANYKEHKIRLAGIDAPERKQAYRLASRNDDCHNLLNNWRRGRDSNPRTLTGQRFSRPPLSTAQPPLLVSFYQASQPLRNPQPRFAPGLPTNCQPTDNLFTEIARDL